MPSNKHFLDNIRKKPESHKNMIAAIFALIPALLVGYAQFYMNANNNSENVALENSNTDIKVNNISAMASVGKIFSESKANISDALSEFKEIDKKMLSDVSLDDTANINSSETATQTTSRIEENEITITSE